jgi:hypothetical protein
VIRRDGKTVLRENRTFERRSIMAAGMEKREEDLARPGVMVATCPAPRRMIKVRPRLTFRRGRARDGGDHGYVELNYGRDA